MTTPTAMPIEDRLRAHFAERASVMEIPGPEHDTRLAAAREGRPPDVSGDGGLTRIRPPARSGRRRRRGLLLAAAAAIVVLVATGVLTGRDGDHDVRTDPTRAPATEVPPTTEAETPTTVAPEPAAPPPVEGAAPVPTPVGPIVGAVGILGSWDGSAWVRWDPRDPAPSARDYQVVGLSGPPVVVAGRPSGGGCGALDDVPNVDVGLEVGDQVVSRAGVAVASAGDVLPRPVEVLDPSGDVYRQAAVEVGMSLGVAQPDPTVTQVVRADLDGDGTAEVLVIAEQLADPSTSLAHTGDWAAAFVRRVVGGEVRTSVIASQVTTEVDGFFLLRHGIAAVADLNGDALMEVVLNQGYYEGRSTTVYEYRDGSLVEVLGTTCGV